MKIRITRSVVPNLLTLGNIFSGFTAIIYISNNNIKAAAVFILLAGIFDMLDGVTARLINAASELGAELDSLCDAVSFGVAPAFMLYKTFFFQFGEMGILLASFPALGGVLRLARFNILLSTFEDKLYYRGMPIPSAAITIISYVIFFHYDQSLSETFRYFTPFFLTIGIPLLMVSNIKFDNLPRPTKRSFQERPFVFVIFVIALISVILSKGKLLFPFMIFYVFASSIRHFANWLKGRSHPIDEFDENVEDDL
jgi:CDP-diacylglycerol--serine O-phosphatidyltransferase